MTRLSSAVALSILGFSFAYGCASKDEADDDDDIPSTTSPTTTTATGGSGSGGTTGGQSQTSGGSGGTGNSSGTGDSTTGGPVPIGEACPEHEELGSCGQGAESAKPKPVNMLIVLDKSGSMDHETNGVQKWGAMKDALSAALEDVAENINFGLELYPMPELASDVILKSCGEAGNCCEMPDHNNMDVPIGSGIEAVNMIVEELDDTDPGGGTPTARALERALAYFTTGEGADLEGDKFVLLATDGGPNCNSELQCGADLCTYNLDGMQDCTMFADQNCCEGSSEPGGGDGCVDSFNVVDRIDNLKEEGIDTFVVGIPGTEAYSDFLDEFAEAGGRSVSGDGNRYYRVDDVAELTQVFRDITIQLVTSCELEIPQSTSTLPPKVVVDCDLIPRFEDGAGGESGQVTNWEWTPGSETITLVGDSCERVSQGVDRIDVVLDCDIPE